MTAMTFPLGPRNSNISILSIALHGEDRYEDLIGGLLGLSDTVVFAYDTVIQHHMEQL